MIIWLRCLSTTFLLLFTLLPAPAQRTSPPDTMSVNMLIDKALAIENIKPTEAMQLYRQALALAQQIQFTKGYFESIRNLTFALNNASHHDEARALALAGLAVARKDTALRPYGICHFALGHTAMMAGDMQEAVRQFHQSATYMRRQNNRRSLAAVYNNLGMIYQHQDLYQLAIEHFQKALDVFTPTLKTDYRDVAISQFNIGVSYGHLKDYKKARQHYALARRLIDPAKDFDFLVTLYNNVGFIFSVEAKFDSALHYQREALRLSRVLDNPRHEVHQLMLLGQTHIMLKRYKQAKQYLDESYRLARKNDVGLIEFQSIYRNYSDLYDSTRNYKAALDWYEKYAVVTDSLDNRATKELLQSYEEKIRRAEARQTLLAKQRQIDRLEGERNRQNLWLWLAIISASATGALLLVGLLLYRQRQRANANALLALQREQELVAIRAELEGQQKERLRISKEMHDDLGASLTTIGLLSEVMKTRLATSSAPEVEKISELSAEMVTAMNEIIWSLNTRNDSLNGLIAYIRSYAREFIENTALSLHIQADEAPEDLSVPGEDRRHIFLTVKEALNNVVKHAQATHVTLRILPRRQQLRIEVCDNGQGFVAPSGHRPRNGLANMRNRMEQVGGLCAITSSATEGTCVRITYPYQPVAAEKILQM